MNGAELPSGAILRVEPADSGYSQQTTNTSAYGPAAALAMQENNIQKEEPVPAAEADNDDGDNDSTGDLDDFFESLE